MGLLLHACLAALFFSGLWCLSWEGRIALVLVLSGSLLVFSKLQPCGHGTGKLYRCSSNQNGLATALEMYATDNVGTYPSSLALLTPSYLKTLPTCPTGGPGYARTYRTCTDPNAFTFYCTGDHDTLRSGYPRYSSHAGLVSEPDDAR